MERLNASPYAERNLKIFAAMDQPRQRGDLDDLVNIFSLSKSRLRQIHAEGEKKIELFELTLTDGKQKIPVAEVESADGFVAAARCAVTNYSAMFARLELPCWSIVSQYGHRSDLASLR